jgi:hypothetical protein
VLDYLDDIESDLSAFHRIDDLYALDGPRFFRLAVRLTSYAGVMQARAVALEEERKGGSSPGPTSHRQGDDTPRQVDASVARNLLLS